MTAKQIRYEALVRLEGNWTEMIGATMLTALIYFIFGYAYILLAPMLLPGLALFGLKIVRGERPDIADIFSGYKMYLNSLVAFVLLAVILTVGYLLFVIPGLVFTYMYFQVFFIMADNPDISPIDALSRSARMMKGYKWKLFCLHLSFTGWILLCILTLGIACIWISPYTAIANTVFYNELKKAEETGSSETE